MKILIISPQYNPLPSPKGRIFSRGVFIYNLANSLKKRGHEVKVYAAADSLKGDFAIENFGIKSTFSHQCPDKKINAYRSSQHELYAISAAFNEYKKGGYDLLILNSFSQTLYFTDFVQGPVACIHHTSPSQGFDLECDLDYLRQKRFYNRVKFIAISHRQKELGKVFFNYAAVIHHGVDLKKFPLKLKPNKEFLFAGRLAESKQPDVAIKIALAAGQKIDLIGNAGKNGKDKYWVEILKPLIEKYQKNVSLKGCIPYREMKKYYGKAKALIFPINWEEPFGLVMIEAMACGTPVIAFKMGAVPEVIVDGKTGFICPPGDEKAMIKAVKKIALMPEKEYLQMRKHCRAHVEKYFSLDRMINDYEKVMEKIISDWQKKKK